MIPFNRKLGENNFEIILLFKKMIFIILNATVALFDFYDFFGFYLNFKNSSPYSWYFSDHFGI